MTRGEFLSAVGLTALLVSCKRELQIPTPLVATPRADGLPTVSPQELALNKQLDFQRMKQNLANNLDPVANASLWTALNAVSPANLDSHFSTTTSVRPGSGFDLLIAEVPYDGLKAKVEVREWFDGAEVLTFYTDKAGNLRDGLQEDLIPLEEMKSIVKGKLRFSPDEWMKTVVQAPTAYSTGRDVAMYAAEGTVKVDGKDKTVRLIPNGMVTILTHP